MKLTATLAFTSVMVVALIGAAGAQTWAPLVNQPGANVGAMLQLRDGRILVHEEQNGNSTAWHILTPDATGSYVNGTWSSGGHMQPGYAPWFFGSQVMMDGKTVVIEGGEYNGGQSVWTTKGSIGTISGSTFKWVANSPPTGWTSIGDAESVMLPDGTYMQSNCCTNQNAFFAGPNSWTATGSVNQANNDEAGFVLLSNGLVLTVDTKNSSCGGSIGSELYDPSTGVWSCGPNTPVKLYNPNDEELGAAVLMYNNKVLQFGGNVVATAIYDVASNTWAAGPTPANNLDQADGPAALEPNGKVLAMLSPGVFKDGCQFVEYHPDNNNLTNAANPANCPGDSSFVGHLMILPTGQIMFTDFTGRVEIFTPTSGVVSGVAPTINPVSGSIGSPSTNNVLSGTQLNGLTENNGYGDDYQSATNYPLVRLVQIDSPNNVYYATTHDENTHSIAPNTQVTTNFDVPAGLPQGSYHLYAVANGIQSNPIVVNIAAGGGPDFSLTANPSSVSVVQGHTGTSTITVVPSNGFSDTVNLTASGLPSGVTAGFSPNPTSTTSTVTFTATASAPTGTSTVTVTGVSGSLTHTTMVSLTVTTSGGGTTVTVSPTSLTWGSVALGTSGAGKAVTLTNTGTSTLNISNIAVSGDYALTTSAKPCGSTLAVGKNCKIEVTFTPTQLGVRTGTLTITDNAAGSPQTVALSGTGIAQATLTPVTKSFGSVVVGASSAAKVFTLANKQSVALTGISIATTGDYSVSTTTCSTSLAAKATCTISVVFSPTQKGTRTGQLSVSDSALNSPQTSSLTGTGK